MSMYYDKDGKPLDTLSWARLFENFDYKRVGLWKGKKYRVSTVWLGLDHSFLDSKPLIFETMVFNVKGRNINKDLDMQRYTTLKEAEQGHKRMVIKWAEKEKQE